MVKRYNDAGTGWWYEPPFTPEEEAMLGPINAPPVAVLKEPAKREEPPEEVHRRKNADRAP